MSRRVYIALFAVLTELVAVAASSNQGVTNFVKHHMATSALGDAFLRSIPSFPWRFSTEDRSGAVTVLVGQYAAIATLFVFTFVLLLIMVRGKPTFSGPFFTAFCAVVVAALAGHMVGKVVSYDYDPDGRASHTGLGRVGYSLFNSNGPLTIVYALMLGVVVAIVVGIVGLIMRRRTRSAESAAAEVEPDMFAPGTMASQYANPGAAVAGAGAGFGGFGEPAPWGTQQSYTPAEQYAPTETFPATEPYAPGESYAAPVAYAPPVAESVEAPVANPEVQAEEAHVEPATEQVSREEPETTQAADATVTAVPLTPELPPELEAETGVDSAPRAAEANAEDNAGENHAPEPSGGGEAAR